MLETFEAPMRTLGGHVGPAFWAMGVFAFGFLLAFVVTRLDVGSLLAIPTLLFRFGKKYLTPRLSPVLLFAFIFLFNSIVIFIYMLSGGFVVLPIVFALFTGLNVGVILLLDAREAMLEPPDPPGEVAAPRAWVGFLCLFTVVVELSAFWLAIGMGMTLGNEMHEAFAWATFVKAAGPRVLAYGLVLVPALALSAAAEATAVSAMIRRSSHQ